MWCVRRMVACGTWSINEPDAEGRTALAHAVSARSYAIIDALIALGADVDTRFPNGRDTPLMHACRRGDMEMVQHLFTGARPNVHLMNDKGETAITMLCQRDDALLLEQVLWFHWRTNPLDLHAVDEDDNDPILLCVACSMNATSCIRAMITFGIKPCGRRSTCAALLSGWGNTEMLKLLLSCSADVNEGRAERNPILLASMRGHAGCVATLLDHGAHVEGNVDWMGR